MITAIEEQSTSSSDSEDEACQFPVDAHDGSRKSRKRISVAGRSHRACSECRALKRSCDGDGKQPCSRCIDRGVASQCLYMPRKKRTCRPGGIPELFHEPSFTTSAAKQHSSDQCMTASSMKTASAIQSFPPFASGRHLLASPNPEHFHSPHLHLPRPGMPGVDRFYAPQHHQQQHQLFQQHQLLQQQQEHLQPNSCSGISDVYARSRVASGGLFPVQNPQFHQSAFISASSQGPVHYLPHRATVHAPQTIPGVSNAALSSSVAQQCAHHLSPAGGPSFPHSQQVMKIQSLLAQDVPLDPVTEQQPSTAASDADVRKFQTLLTEFISMFSDVSNFEAAISACPLVEGPVTNSDIQLRHEWPPELHTVPSSSSSSSSSATSSTTNSADCVVTKVSSSGAPSGFPASSESPPGILHPLIVEICHEVLAADPQVRQETILAFALKHAFELDKPLLEIIGKFKNRIKYSDPVSTQRISSGVDALMAEDALLRSRMEDMIRAIHSFPFPAFMVAAKGLFYQINGALLDISVFTREQLLASDFNPCEIWEQEQETLKHILPMVIHAKENPGFKTNVMLLKLKRKDRADVLYSVGHSFVRDSRDALIGVVGFCTPLPPTVTTHPSAVPAFLL
eukprot:ANDGO_07150.mRNA.1 hypothetical protein